MLATLFLSQGIPMLVAGDEIGRTQGGNNNAYAQDNEVSWLDWEGADHDLPNKQRKRTTGRKSLRRSCAVCHDATNDKMRVVFYGGTAHE